MKKPSLLKCGNVCVPACILITITVLAHLAAEGQSCPSSSTTTINSYANTYYPGTAGANAGTTSITLGNAVGSAPIAALDILLVIQMQGAQITSSNTFAYGNGSTGSGYLSNANLLAGKMEYVVAASAVALTGGVRTLTLQSALVNSYQSSAYGANGQYTFQVIRVPVYYNLTLGATITPPAWNGATGGVVVLHATQTLNMNGKTIDASGAGFRGGGGKQFKNGGGSGVYTDYMALTTAKANGSKGEGIAGTPRYINNNWASSALDNIVEGYPGGSMNMGAPANAGGGATDGTPTGNSNNAGGGGGGNGGAGGIGGHGWSTNTRATGGLPGAIFAQAGPSRLVMGGGGGAGSTDGGTGIYGPPVGGTPGSGISSSGMPGGGIVMVTAGNITGTGTINASGLYTNTQLANDGSGGGGGGGSVVVLTGSGLSGVTVYADGSDGSSNTGGGAQHGPGGGGGGGFIYSNGALAASSVNGGDAGTTANANFGGITYYAAAGASGTQNLAITQSQTPVFPINCAVLATAFLSASALYQNGDCTLSWQVSNEEAIQNYVIERSFDGNNFATAGVVAYKRASGSINDYSYSDPGTGSIHPLVYYRIRQVSLDGHSVFSRVVLVKLLMYAALMVRPNPVAESATLSFISDRIADVSIRLINMSGNSVWHKQYMAGTGMNSLQLDHLQELPNGIYVVQLYDGENYEKVKMVIRH
ncbi:T9SS type A sorting domain-containing protein [Flavitalea flava]